MFGGQSNDCSGLKLAGVRTAPQEFDGLTALVDETAGAQRDGLPILGRLEVGVQGYRRKRARFSF